MGPRLPLYLRPDGNPKQYTVFVKGRSFTVVQPNDLSFLNYFYRLRPLCVPKTLYALVTRWNYLTYANYEPMTWYGAVAPVDVAKWHLGRLRWQSLR
jgi:hypothetical protein